MQDQGKALPRSPAAVEEGEGEALPAEEEEPAEEAGPPQPRLRPTSPASHLSSPPSWSA